MLGVFKSDKERVEHEALTADVHKHKVFLFKDEKSNTYGYPIIAQTRGMFVRDVQDELSKGQAVWARHPQDFAIYEIGEYDISRGDIVLYGNKNCLGLVQDFRQSLGN